MTINVPMALQAAINELAEMRADLQPFIGETGPARGMSRRLDRVLATLRKVRDDCVADEYEERTTSDGVRATSEGGKARYD